MLAKYSYLIHKSSFKVLLGIICLFIINVLQGSCQTSNPAYFQLDREKGLKSTMVFCVHQDTKGFIWIGTNRGPIRFDGKNFEEFPSQEPGLNGTSVFHIQDDGTGKVWMSTMGGYIFYHERDSIYKTIQSEVVESYRGQFDLLLDFYVDEKGGTYQVLQNLGILHIDATGKDSLYQAENCFDLFALDLEEKVLITEKYNKDCSNLRNKRYPYTLSSIAIQSTHRTYGNIPLAIFNEASYFNRSIRIAEYEYIVFRRGNLHHINKGIVLNERPMANHACTFSKGPDGRIYVGMINNEGVHIYEDVEDLFSGEPDIYFKGHSVGYITWDVNDGCWLGTLDAGVFYVPDWQLKVMDESTGLSSSYITSVASIEENRIFAGTRDGNIVQIDSSISKIKFLTNEPQIPYVFNYYFHEQDDKLFFTTGAGALSVLNLKTQQNRFNILQNLPNGVGAKLIHAPANKNYIWIYGYAGFAKFDPANEVIIQSSSSINYRDRTYALVENAYGEIYIGNSKGLWKYQNDTIVFPNFGHAIENSVITALVWVADKELLIIGSTTEGIGLWNGKELISLKGKTGLLQSTVRVLFSDSRNTIWSGTDDGLNRIQILENDSIDIQTFTHLDGLPANGITGIAEIEKQIVVGTGKGLVFLPQKKKLQFSTAPIIYKIKLFNELVDPIRLFSLSYKENFLTFKFITVDPGQMGHIQYRYKINSWSHWINTAENEITFSALSPGSYIFEVQSKFKGSPWGSSTLQSFKIYLPWWQTWWFFSLVAILSFGIVVFIYKNRLNNVKRQKEIDQELNRLERTALRAQMNPHFIFNCLNSIQNLIAQDDKDNANRYLARFANLVRGALNMSSETKVCLDDDINMIKNYLDLERLRFKDKFEYQIILDDAINLFDIEVPPMLVQPFVENALKHGFAGLDRKGSINISYTLCQGNTLKICVEDNGMGYKVHREATKTKKYKSKGMDITARRIQILKNDNRNPIEIIQLENEVGMAIGTSVIIQIPLL